MRTEAARYAADAAKREEEAKRAKAPLEKLQRPTLVSRTDTSVTLNLYRGKNQSTLPSDRRWELSLKKERERDYAVFTSVKGKTVVTVSDLDPGTRYCFKARVGRVGSDGDEVTEWGPHSVESAYATTGKPPPPERGGGAEREKGGSNKNVAPDPTGSSAATSGEGENKGPEEPPGTNAGSAPGLGKKARKKLAAQAAKAAEEESRATRARRRRRRRRIWRRRRGGRRCGSPQRRRRSARCARWRRSGKSSSPRS